MIDKIVPLTQRVEHFSSQSQTLNNKSIIVYHLRSFLEFKNCSYNESLNLMSITSEILSI